MQVLFFTRSGPGVMEVPYETKDSDDPRYKSFGRPRLPLQLLLPEQTIEAGKPLSSLYAVQVRRFALQYVHMFRPKHLKWQRESVKWEKELARKAWMTWAWDFLGMDQNYVKACALDNQDHEAFITMPVYVEQEKVFSI